MTDWLRTSASHPCQICKKDNWCLWSDTGDFLCMRQESRIPMACGGWLHKAEGNLPPVMRPKQKPIAPPPSLDAVAWWNAARRAINLEALDVWAERLGIPCSYLLFMGATTACEMLCFPMRDATGKICGIRTRNINGDKKAITGSKAGVFLPGVHDASREVIICEGPTDAASAMAFGFEPIGRPSCLGCEAQVIDTLKRFGTKQVTLCADNDGPGIRGAKKLLDTIRAARIGVRVVTPGIHKDLRDWLKAGATPDDVRNQWSQAEWR